METNSMINNNNDNNNDKDDEQLELPPGFRFHPTDEELITHYLSQKVTDNCFSAIAIGEVDLNKSEPWDLPSRAKMGEKEWYFFCVRDRKYPTGLRTNRATNAGYWKATGKDKEIYKAKTLVGMKKTLVFYKGRAPKGSKTNWVMHEFRLEGKYSAYNLPKTAKNEWVICRVFQKCPGGKKTHIAGLVRYGNEVRQSLLPPLMDSSSSPNSCETRINGGHASHVTCFSNYTEDKKEHENMVDDHNNHSFNTCSLFMASSSSNIPPVSSLFPKSAIQNSLFFPQIPPTYSNLEYQDPVLMPEQESILRMLLENQVPKLKHKSKMEISQATGLNPDMSCVIFSPEMARTSFHDQEAPPIPSAPVDLDCLWSY